MSAGELHDPGVGSVDEQGLPFAQHAVRDALGPVSGHDAVDGLEATQARRQDTRPAL